MEKAQLRWRCRRGMKELDVLLERYLAHRYDAAPLAEQQTFEALLEQEDPQIWSWVMSFEPLPKAPMGGVIEQLREYR